MDSSTTEDFSVVQNENGRSITRKIKHYNLDMIISVGYRIKSKKATLFRKWATNILNQYLVRGYAVNKKRLLQLEKQINVLEITSRLDKEIIDEESTHLLTAIIDYNKALQLLDDYDHKNISKPKGTTAVYVLTYEECMEIINKMKYDSDVFALEKDSSFKSSIATIYQTFDNKDLYPTTEEKAANLLYLITKNHSFVDGNKRIAASIFLYFLDRNNLLYKNNQKIISDSTLVAITILIAGSNPEEKEIIISMIMNFLQVQ